MKGQDLLESLGYIEEELIADADEEVALSVGIGWKRWTALAACMVLAVVTVFMLITQHPFDDDVILMPTDGTIKSTNTTITNTSDSLVVPPPDSPYPTKITSPTTSQTSGTTPSSTTRTHIHSFPPPPSSTISVTSPSTTPTTPQKPASTGTSTAPSVGPTSSIDPTTPTVDSSSVSTGMTGVVTPPTGGPIDGEPPPQAPSMTKPTIYPEADLLDQLLRDYQQVMYRPSAPGHIEAVSVSIDRYIGRYGDVTAVRIRDEESRMLTNQTLTIAGITVHIPAGWPLWLYRDGEFCTLPEAYEAGWITAADVEDIDRKLNE